MKMSAWLLVGVMIVLLMSRSVMAQITPEQAKQAVRSFEGDPNLQLPEPEEESYPEAPVAKYLYSFYLRERNRIYDVDKETGRVVFASYGFSQPRQGTPIAREQAIQIARNFLNQRSIVYQQYRERMEVVAFEDLYDIYSIIFAEKIPENGAYSNNSCVVKLSVYTGAIRLFEQYWESAPHPNRTRQPVITAQEAANKVAAYFGFSAWDYLPDYPPRLGALPADWAPFNWNTSGLVWKVSIVGDEDRAVLGIVDALKGTILMTDKYISAGLSPYPKVERPKVRLWVDGTERIEQTPLGSVYTADGFALKCITPIIQQFRHSSEFTWLPLEVFKRFGAKVTEARGKMTLSTEKQSKMTEKFLKREGQIYLPAKLLEELFPDKVIAVTTHEEGWVCIIVRRKECLKPFKDLKEEIRYEQNLRYKTKYRSFLDKREGQWAVRIGLISLLCILAILFAWKRRRFWAA